MQGRELYHKDTPAYSYETSRCFVHPSIFWNLVQRRGTHSSYRPLRGKRYSR